MLSQSYSTQSPEAFLAEPGVLAVVTFGNSCAPGATPGLIPVGVESLSGQGCEVIRYGKGLAERGETGQCQWSRNEDVICAATWIPAADCADIETATCLAYQRLFTCIHSQGFNHPFRIWNFIPHINRGLGDSEEYKKFCVGRQRAFDSLKLAHRQYPAASALGHHGEGAVIYLLAHREPGQHHENSRQQPAYEYPREYGPCSPSFARATSLALQNTLSVFVSGTASIIGHNTEAAGNLQQQLTITLENIHHLVNSVAPKAEALTAVRVYLRRREDYPAALAYLSTRFPPAVMNFLHADICRDNLLVEIEAASHQVEASFQVESSFQVSDS